MSEDQPFYVVVGGSVLKVLLGGFLDAAQAQTFADSANGWYGPDHPLTPIKVEPVKMNPRPFPVAALRAMESATTPDEENAAMGAMFASLVEDPQPVTQTARPAGFLGGRKR